MKKKIVTFFNILTFLFHLNAQNQPLPTHAADRWRAFEQRKTLKENSILQNIPFHSVGPTVMGGRVVDIDVKETDPTHFLVAYASGGLWKTENNGTSFAPIFDKEAVMTIGDIAANWKQNIIWVGTGENNSSRSSYAGVGVYKSSDGGKTWQHKGLEESHHIGRIILHPTDTNTLWVAVLGHLYSPSEERGIFKTTDGGATWTKTLFVDNTTGAIDIVADPLNINVLYAATWQRHRKAWNFVGSGTNSGIWKSVDGGTTWQLSTDRKSGFLVGEGIGRIGLCATAMNSKTVIFAVCDNQNRRPLTEKKNKTEELTKKVLQSITKENFVKLNKSKITAFLRNNNFPKKYTTKRIIDLVKSDSIKPINLVEYLEDANTKLFDTEVVGAEVWRSDDDGKQWKKVNKEYIDDTYSSYGYYFGQLRVSQQNPSNLYILGVPILRSEDGGSTFASIDGDNVHSDHHALWINSVDERHLINGNDGGVNISYDFGKNWQKCNTPAVGQFYAINVDMAEPYNIYGGLQDNGVWKGPSSYKASVGWHNGGKYPYEWIAGGDGMQIEIDSRDNQIIYTGSQFGYYSRINGRTGKRKNITPRHDIGERPYRFNWQTPIHLSCHNQDIIYFGAHKLFRSMNQGEDWEAISPDLTAGGAIGNVPFGTISCLNESTKKFGLIYIGTDDGNLAVTKDGGNSWKMIQTNLPQSLWVTRVQASRFELGRVYIALNGYRNDHFKSYLYLSEDYGDTWKPIFTDLPDEPVNVIKEDTKNKNLVYVGTDHGLYVSLDGGASSMLMENNLPNVPIHDIVIHPRDNDLIVGTHGRSLYVASVKELQQLDKNILSKDFYIFDIQPIRFDSDWGNTSNKWDKVEDPMHKIPVYTAQNRTIEIVIKNEKGLVLQQFSKNVTKGINYVDYDMTIDPKILSQYERFLNEKQDTEKEEEEKMSLEPSKTNHYYLQKGAYTIEVKASGRTFSQKLINR